jgi:hypothetical protein
VAAMVAPSASAITASRAFISCFDGLA